MHTEKIRFELSEQDQKALNKVSTFWGEIYMFVYSSLFISGVCGV